jgi:Uma2 family endonuclease
VDERLVMPETRYEVFHGRVVYVAPSDPPHAIHHSKLAGLLEAHVAPAYEAAVDMLTRTSEVSDMAPDASVFPRQRDPETGARRIEELAFEVMSTQTLTATGHRAAELVGRGVRRVFAVDVRRQRALEWSRATESWELLRNDGHLEDVTLAAPLPIDALVGAAKTDDAMATALLTRRNPVLVAALDRQRADGKAEGKADALLRVLASRGLVLTPEDRERVRTAVDEATLDRWLERALAGLGLAEILGSDRNP